VGHPPLRYRPQQFYRSLLYIFPCRAGGAAAHLRLHAIVAIVATSLIGITVIIFSLARNAAGYLRDSLIRAGTKLYAYSLDVPNLGPKLERRLNPGQAEKHRLFDPITIGVEEGKTKDQRLKVLDERKIRHSPIIVGLQAWLIVLEDHDQSRLRLYTLETQGRVLKANEENSWLRN
jgi:hypothetical protein